MSLQGVKPAKRLAKQAGKLRSIFKKQGTEEHARSSKEVLPAGFNDQLHRVYGNAVESSPPQVSKGVDPEDGFAPAFRARRREENLATRREIANWEECFPESLLERPESPDPPNYIFGSHQSLTGSDTREQDLEPVQTYTSQSSFSPRPWDSDLNRKRPGRLITWKAKINAKGANHSEPALRTKASHSSLISFSGSVHSLTSRTYRSASGES